MKRISFLFILLISPCLFAIELPKGFQEELVVYGLRMPTAAVYAPDGRLFIAEKEGKVRIFKDGRLLSKPFLTVPVNTFSERGLDGIVLDPNFEENQYVYIYYTTSASSPKNQLARYTANGDIALPGSRKILLKNIRSDAGFHNGAGLAFGPDGKLYVSTGDGGLYPNLSQALESANGKILRINPDGSIPDDNPFVNQTGARKEIWCYGFRNPYRFSFHPETGMMAIGDVGADLYEEINIGKRGANYGWPLAEGPSTDLSLTNPAYYYDHSEGGAAVIVGPFYTATRYPLKYRGRLFFTDYSRGFIKTLRFDSDGQPLAVELFVSGLSSPSHLLLAPDGNMEYVSINAGEIRKIRYVGGANRQPVAVSRSSKRAGVAPLAVRFTSTGSYDPDGDPLEFLWDFGDGSTSTLSNASHHFTQNGTYYVSLTVNDQHGASGYARSIKITVGNLPPTAEILTPKPGLTVGLGETISFSGRGTDPEDGVIPPERMKWTVKLHHNDHTHPFSGGMFGASGSFTAPLASHGAGTIFLRLTLRVLDSDGLSNSDQVDINVLN